MSKFDTEAVRNINILEPKKSENYQNNDSKVNASILSDETWLYKPSKIASFDSDQSVQFWLRAVFDSPDSCFFYSRRNLLSRLEAIISSGGNTNLYSNSLSGSVPSLNEFPFSTSVDEKSKHLSCNLDNSSRGGSSKNLFHLSNADCLSSEIGTFSRLNQPKPSLLPHQSSRVQGVQNSPLSNSLGVNPSSFKSVVKSGSCDEFDTSKSINTNVQEIARIQEDNLKAQVAALVAAAAGRHGSQQSLGRCSPTSGSGAHIASAPGSPHASLTKLTTMGDVDRDGLSVTTSRQPHATEPDNCALRIRQSSYTLLPQKPTLPLACTDSSSADLNPTELRGQFGFRQARKSSVPQSNKLLPNYKSLAAVQLAVSSDSQHE